MIRNRTGYLGVQKSYNKYTARTIINGKRVYIGLYKTAEEAAAAYQKVTGKSYATMNKPRKKSEERVYSPELRARWKDRCVLCPGNRPLKHCWDTGE